MWITAEHYHRGGKISAQIENREQLTGYQWEVCREMFEIVVYHEHN